MIERMEEISKRLGHYIEDQRRAATKAALKEVARHRGLPENRDRIGTFHGIAPANKRRFRSGFAEMAHEGMRPSWFD